MELTQEEKMMMAAKQQIILYTARHDEWKGTRRNLPVLDDACDLTEEEYDTLVEEAYDNLVHSLIEAGGEIRELRLLLTRAYEQLMLLGFDSGFTNDEIRKLTDDISKYLKEIR